MKALLARRDRLGLSWAELSRHCGLPVWTLRQWQARLSSPPRPRKPSRTFVPVRILPSARAELPPLEVITPSGFRVRVPDGFDEGHLLRLLRTLEAGC